MFLELVESADIVIEGFRPGVVDRLGVGYDAARERNPKIVYASLTGYGSDGPMRDAAGHDINYISYAGVLGMTGPPGGPVCQPGVQVGDLGGATMLGHRHARGALRRGAGPVPGSRVEVAMYDAALAWTSIHAGEYWAVGRRARPRRDAAQRQVALLPGLRAAPTAGSSRWEPSRRSSGGTSAGSSAGPTSSSGSTTPTRAPTSPT